MPDKRALRLAGAILAASLVVAAAAPDVLRVCTGNPDPSVAEPACRTVAHDKARSAHDRGVAYAGAGLIALAGQDIDAAHRYFGQSLALDANSDAAYAERAEVEFATGDYDGTISDANKAVTLKPNDRPDAYLLLGTFADRDGDHGARIRLVSKAIALAPAYAEAYAARAVGYTSEQKFDLALADFDKALALKPASPACWRGGTS